MHLRFFLLLFCCVALPSLAQRAGFVTGTIKDMFSERGLPEVKIELLSLPDSAVVDSTRSRWQMKEVPIATFRIQKEDEWLGATFELQAPAEGNYLLRFSLEGYRSLLQPITVHFTARNRYLAAGEFWLGKENQQLAEAVAKVTRLKMYHDGDTLVYNADAFQLDESAMLQDLLKRLPGVQFKEGGLYVNGRFVESILLGGKDFFKDNMETALKNLPSFVVDKVKCYAKAGEASQLMGEDMNDKSYVMDLRLKRNYHNAWLAMPTVGGSDQGHYNMHLYGMRFNERESLSLNMQRNDLNVEQQGVGEMGVAISNGQEQWRTHTSAELNYHREPNERLKWGAQASVKHDDIEKLDGTQSETFLPSGNLHTLTLDDRRQRQLTARTQWDFRLRSKKADKSLEAKYVAQYQRGRDQSLLRTATLTQSPAQLIGTNALDSLFSAQRQERWLRALTHQLRNQLLRDSREWKQEATLTGRWGWAPHLLTLSLRGNGTWLKQDDYEHYDLRFFSQGQAQRDFRNRWQQLDTRHYQGALRLDDTWKYLRGTEGEGWLTLAYELEQRYEDKEHPLYRLDRLDQWGQNTAYALGALPSLREERQRAIDVENSLHATRHTTRQELQVQAAHLWELPNLTWLKASATLPLQHQYGALDYTRAQRHFAPTRHDLFFQPKLSLVWHPWREDKEGTRWLLSAAYESRATAPDLHYLIDLRSDADPLNISLGNPHLQAERTHTWTFEVAKRHWEGSELWSTLTLTHERSDHAIAMGSSYDRATGVRTYRPENVEGNHWWKVAGNLYFPVSIVYVGLLAEQRWQQSVDLNQLSGTTSAQAQQVNAHQQRYDLVARWMNDASEVELSWTSFFHKSRGTRSDFTPIDLQHHTLTFGCETLLPWIETFLRTELAANFYRGNNSPDFNRNEWNWNVELSRRFWKKRLRLSFSANDILRQRTPYTYLLDAQGRTERIAHRFLGSYYLLSLTYFLRPAKQKTPFL